MKIKISAMELLGHARNENAVVAGFTAQLGDLLRLEGCSILRLAADGHLSVLTPQGKRTNRTVTFMNADIHRQFREKAIAMYLLMTGEDGAPVEAPSEEADDAGMRRFIGEAA